MLAKRLFALLAALTGLILLAPAALLVAAWIRWDSPGPALYRQWRVGRHGRPFRIYKWRTMRVDTDDDTGVYAGSARQLTVGRDPRITRAGRLLRARKLDELPQLLNVVLGDMSLVGPRPEVPRYVACYPPAVRDVVLSVPPGITDWAALRYRDESRLLGEAADPEQTYLTTILPVKLGYYQRAVSS
jgi:lipopolysaccharide/colanic/teichoic acid biosynthesis glycosyltransferase